MVCPIEQALHVVPQVKKGSLTLPFCWYVWGLTYHTFRPFWFRCKNSVIVKEIVQGVSINFDRDKLTHANSCTCTIQCIMLVIWLSVFCPAIGQLAVHILQCKPNAISYFAVDMLQCEPKCYWSNYGPYLTVRTKMLLVNLRSILYSANQNAIGHFAVRPYVTVRTKISKANVHFTAY